MQIKTLQNLLNNLILYVYPYSSNRGIFADINLISYSCKRHFWLISYFVSKLFDINLNLGACLWLLVKLLFFFCSYMFVFTWWFSFLIWPRHDSQQAAKLCQCPTNAAQNEPIMNIFSLFLSVCPNTLHTVLLGINRPWIMVFIIQLPNLQIYWWTKNIIYQ